MNAITPVRGPLVPVVLMHDGAPMADSRDVARYFAKEHKAVIRSIREAKCSEEFRRRNFAPNYSKDLDGKTYTDYVLMTKSGFAFVVLAFTGDKAAPFREDYISAFDRMEADLRSRPVVDPMAALQDPRQLLQLLGTYAQRTIELEGQVAEKAHALLIARDTIEEQAVTVAAHDLIANADGAHCVTDVAKLLGVKPSALFVYMRNREAKVRWFYQRNEGGDDIGWQERLDAEELVEVPETVRIKKPDGTVRDKLVIKLRVTPLGITKLARLLVEAKDTKLPTPIDLVHLSRLSRGDMTSRPRAKGGGPGLFD